MRSPLVVLGVMGLVLAGAGPAAAEPPLSVSGPITDEVGALEGDEPAVRAAIDELSAESELEMYAVLVSSFDSLAEDDWLAQSAELSELEGSDILVAVAVGEDTYEYGWWVDEAFPLSVVEVEAVITSDVVPEFESADWDAGLIALADQLRSMSGDVADEEEQTPAWSATTTMLVVGGVAVVLIAAHLFTRRRTPAGPSR